MGYGYGQKLTLDNIVNFAVIIFFGMVSLYLMQGRNAQWLIDIFKDSGEAQILGLIVLIYATPAYLGLAGLNYLTNRVLGKAEQASIKGKIKKGINSAHSMVSFVPAIIGGILIIAAYLIKKYFIRKGIATGEEFLLLVNHKSIGNLVGIVLYASFEYGAIGEIARGILFYLVVLYVPVLALSILFLFYSKYVKRHLGN